MSQEKVLFEKSIQNVNSILKVTGLQFIDGNNDKRLVPRLRRRWFFCTAMFVINTDIFAEVAWFINAIRIGKPLVDLTYAAPAITHCFLAYVKAFFYLKNEPHVNDLVSTLQMLQNITVTGKLRNEVEKELERRTHFLKTATNIQYWLNIVSLAGFAILPFIIMGLTYKETGNIERMIPFVMLYPFDTTNKYIWPFMFVKEMWSAIVIVFLVLGVDSVYYAICTFIQIQFRHLHYDLERIVSGHRNPVHFQKEFSVCMKRHNELIRCVGLIEVMYSKSTLFNFVSSSMLICLTGFNITAIPSWPTVIPFTGFVFLVSGQIYLFCYFGDMIMRSSSAISDAVYNCRWYNADRPVKRDLLFVLTRAHKPCKLTACGFSDVNLNSFSRILSTAWSYFALLTTVNGSFKSDSPSN